MRTLWPFAGGAKAASSGVDGAVLTSAQTLDAGQQAQVLTNIDANDYSVALEASATVSTDTTTYQDSALTLSLPAGTWWVEWVSIATCSDLTKGTKQRMRFGTNDSIPGEGISPANPFFSYKSKPVSTTTAGWPGYFSPDFLNAARSNAIISTNASSYYEAKVKVTIPTATSITLQIASNTAGANTVTHQGGSFLRAWRAG